MGEDSQSGRPQTNAIIERENQDILGGIRTYLIDAGIPLEFWPFAAEHYAFNHNVTATDDQSAYFWTHEENYKGKILPFGCHVICRPSFTKADRPTHKMAGPTIDGILCGYEIGPGYVWTGRYKCWGLNEFLNTNLDMDAKSMSMAHRSPHICDVVELPKEGLVFPLKAE